MFCLNDTMRYYLCPGRADMRKGIRSLCGVVHEQMGCKVMNGDVFIFIGSRCKLMKLLYAEDGMVLVHALYRIAYKSIFVNFELKTLILIFSQQAFKME